MRLTPKKTISPSLRRPIPRIHPHIPRHHEEFGHGAHQRVEHRLGQYAFETEQAPRNFGSVLNPLFNVTGKAPAGHVPPRRHAVYRAHSGIAKSVGPAGMHMNPDIIRTAEGAPQATAK